LGRALAIHMVCRRSVQNPQRSRSDFLRRHQSIGQWVARRGRVFLEGMRSEAREAAGMIGREQIVKLPVNSRKPGGSRRSGRNGRPLRAPEPAPPLQNIFAYQLLKIIVLIDKVRIKFFWCSQGYLPLPIPICARKLFYLPVGATGESPFCCILAKGHYLKRWHY